MGGMRAQGVGEEGTEIGAPQVHRSVWRHGLGIALQDAMLVAPALELTRILRIDHVGGGGAVQPVVGVLGGVGEAGAERRARLDDGDLEGRGGSAD